MYLIAYAHQQVEQHRCCTKCIRNDTVSKVELSVMMEREHGSVYGNQVVEKDRNVDPEVPFGNDGSCSILVKYSLDGEDGRLSEDSNEEGLVHGSRFEL